MPSSTVSYIYDADGNKVSMNDGTEKRYLIDSKQPYAQVIAEYDNVLNANVNYTFGLERISQERGVDKKTYLADGTGSIRWLVDGSGVVSDSYDYFAFGELLRATGSTENEFRYVGEAFDANSGFYYLRARWMNPESGRFLSMDPYAGDPMAPVSLHRYLYANVSPITYYDPSGNMGLMQATAAISIVATLSNIAIVSNYLRILAKGDKKSSFEDCWFSCMDTWANKVLATSAMLVTPISLHSKKFLMQTKLKDASSLTTGISAMSTTLYYITKGRITLRPLAQWVGRTPLVYYAGTGIYWTASSALFFQATKCSIDCWGCRK